MVHKTQSLPFAQRHVLASNTAQKALDFINYNIIIRCISDGLCIYRPCMGPCHHGMARPQVADGGTASDMEGSCECIE